ncbi:MAG TPA: VWA domain-containing protein [Pyrinomonadaceae bacterium]|nr:VWA domain-containing protein [Pyrinomonadaceae bacterium]
MKRYLLLMAFASLLVITASGLSRAQQNPSATPAQRDRTVSKTQQQDPAADVIRVETNLVNTLFTAVDKDRHFVTTLKAQDIRIFENDVPQTISVFERETNRPLALAILIDTSESQVGVLELEKQAARVFVDQVLRPNTDQATIISFTGNPRVEQSLTNDRSRLHAGIARVTRGLSQENQYRMANDLDPLPKEQDSTGYTGIWDAAWETIENHLSHAPERSRRAVILLSDGDDTSSTIKRQNVIDYAVKNEVVIYSIGIRDERFPLGKLDSGALKKISDRTGGRAFFPSEAAGLQNAFAQIEQELRSQYLVAYTPTHPNRDGSYRRIRIEILNPELRNEKVRLLYREGYYARKEN